MNIHNFFQGRLGVKDFWKGFALALLIYGCFGLLAPLPIIFISFFINIDSFPILANSIVTIFLCIALIVLLPITGLYVRRIHDLNHSGWFIFLLYFFTILKIAAGVFELDPSLLAVISIFVLIAQLYIWFWPGNRTPNKYGQRVKYLSWWALLMGNHKDSNVV